MDDELSRGQARDYRTYRRTDRQTQATTIPEDKHRPLVTIKGILLNANINVIIEFVLS